MYWVGKLIRVELCLLWRVDYNLSFKFRVLNQQYGYVGFYWLRFFFGKGFDSLLI